MADKYMAKPLFRRREAENYIAVKSIKYHGEVIAPGQSVAHLRLHHLMSLAQRNRIGPKDHPWTQRVLGKWSERHNPKGTDLKVRWDRFDSTHADAAAKVTAEKPETDEDHDWDEPEPVKTGSQWTIEGVTGKFTSKIKAKAAWDGINGS